MKLIFQSLTRDISRTRAIETFPFADPLCNPTLRINCISCKSVPDLGNTLKPHFRQWERTYMHLYTLTCTYMHLYTLTCTYMQIHALTCRYIHFPHQVKHFPHQVKHLISSGQTCYIHNYMHLHADTCTYMHLHALTYTYMQIHTLT